MSALRKGWAGTDLGPYRECGGTYCFFDVQSLPPLPELAGDFAWLPTEPTPVASVEPAAGRVDQPSDPDLPPSYVSFLDRPELMAAVPSCTACYWSPDAPIESPLRDGARLVRFLTDQQDVLFWWLWLGPDGEHRVLCGAIPYHEASVPPERAAQDLIEVAPSFEAFLYRFWVENLAWFEVNERNLPEDQRSPAVRAYLAGYPLPTTD